MNDAELEELAMQRPGYANATPQVQEQIKRQIAAQYGTRKPVQAPSTSSQAVGAIGQIGGAAAGQQAAEAVGGASIGIPVAAAASTILAGKSYLDFLKGNEDKSPTGAYGRAQAAVSTGGLSEVARFTGLGKNIFGGKSKDQLGRDSYREALQKAGVYDDKFNLTLSDGTQVNMGLDGSVKNYNVNFDEKGIGDIVSLVNPFAYILTGGDVKKATDLAGELTNAIKASKDPAAEIRRLYEQVGLTKESAAQAISDLKLDDQTKAIFVDSVNRSGLAAGAPQQQTSAGSSSAASAFAAKIRADSAAARAAQAQAAKVAEASQKHSYRMGLLGDLQEQNKAPVPFPTVAAAQQKAMPNIAPKQNSLKDSRFNTTLNKIIGG